MRWLVVWAAVWLVVAPANAVDVAHGARLARITGCVSCHGPKLDGHLFEEDAKVALLWSSNLSRILPQWTDTHIERTLRSGARPDGSALWFMPTFSHRLLTAADMADLIAWLRRMKPSGKVHPRIAMGPVLRDGVSKGTMYDAAFQARKLASVAPPPSTGPALARGLYLARIACSECHGPKLDGVPDPQPGEAPSLNVAAAYAPAEFRRLLRTGIASGGRKVGLMSEEAPKRLAALTDAEIAAIQAYLNTLPPS